jgi:predicted RNA-binding protein with PIN domain
MFLIIDGYNLLNAVGIVGSGIGPGTLQRSRLALLNFLAESLEPEEIPQATVVFDAQNPPPGLPRVVQHGGLTVHFASQYEDADTLIEELIRAESSPRRLTVVSSDHRLQRAARRRKATAIDSDRWYAEVVRRRGQRQQSLADVPARPPAPLLEEDVNYWIRQFGGESDLTKLIEEESADPAAGQSATAEALSPEEPAIEETASDKPTPEQAAELQNPFPPGYAEDLLADEGIDADDPYDPFPPGYGEDLEE